MRSLLAALVLVVTFMAQAVRAQTFTFVSDMDFAPYSMLSQGRASGIDVEVMTEAARRAGVEIEILLRPWDELVRMVKAGECDGAFALFKDEQRQEYAIFLEAVPLHYSDYVLFTKVGTNFSFRSFDDLAGKTIGRAAGVSLGEEFEAAAKAGKMTLRTYPDQASALSGLISDEVSAYAGNIDVTYNRLKTMGMTSSIIYLPKKILEKKPAYVVLSRASDYPEKAEVGQKLERALDQMRRDGTYRDIAHRYLLRF
ncbi:MAG: transporter substrate-binding domain-containing protein [Pseudodesulfovibrio sp.]|uniref:Extracellular solute-binding protein family 3 n=1 Tax=Pseudodesulfovibrio aespoeensis (strain ATCC 700646 / DSM 10631 / Aspo-2) TaxID=643562 RepID=E6VTW7_PSEA9|nr:MULTISPECIES: transporter substrate-binding domain-containing protein [Pseudodesulfovibrio]MBU4190971.1 transporter substrate-binding domain-containing protein [Pseudomonadota bacterium]ADU61059.1 extracellular solute-binding protein family 3 [Pseudodesulfovibrio aespoeensis Aspo-2]MBU4244078.1 transporter substrate-binding domain-containing protein [Pseudomonadota bacterium]MBU4380125.1 transporter substrate-binding domain-containing protein [Pseudomonadota bacterium]MBU4476405.1 transport